VLTSTFHQLSDGNSSRPLKSSFSVTAEVDGAGLGVGAGAETVGAGAAGEVGVGAVGADDLLHTIVVAAHAPSARMRRPRRIMTSL
jgi:hypothetical protein